MNLTEHPDVWLDLPAWMPRGFDAGLLVRGPLLATCGHQEGDILLVRSIDGLAPPEGAVVVIETGGALACLVFGVKALAPSARVVGVVCGRLIDA